VSVWEIFTSLMDGAGVTILVWALAAAVAIPAALTAGMARLSRSWIVRFIAGAYIEFFRGTSALVQLFILFFVMPFFGVSLSPLVAGILALGLNEGSYGSDVVRGAIQAVPKGQSEAAITLGMSPWTRFRRVILPQAFVEMLPPAGNLAIDLLKLTSLVSLVTLADITFQAQGLRVGAGDPLVIFAVLLAIYFLLSSVITVGFSVLERRARRGLHTGPLTRT
jgi:polar amino acid transport system permease protein